MWKRSSVAVLLLSVVFATGCGSGGASNFNLISIEEEWQLGAQLSQEVASQVRLNQDPAVNAYIRQMGQRIVAASPAPFNQLPWQFHVVEDPSLNAFAIPGGHVYVHTGLIENADNASELAGVMAHEINHVVARHSTEMITRQYGLSIIAGLVLGQNAGQLSQLAAQLIAGGTLARFSRDAEREADELGIRAMYEAGYDPRGMASMFRELLEHSGGGSSNFLSTHPDIEKRIRDADSRAAQFPARQNLVVDEPQFQDIRRRV
jgi:predicted Zn-dependent protease